jgi:hypothetical protein
MVRLAPHQRLHADPDLVRDLPDRIGGRDRAVDRRSEPTDRRGADERAAQRRDAGARQLRLAAKTLQPAGGALARGLDALKALLAALVDRDQLGLELAADLDRQANGVRGRASGHDSV